MFYIRKVPWEPGWAGTCPSGSCHTDHDAFQPTRSIQLTSPGATQDPEIQRQAWPCPFLGTWAPQEAGAMPVVCQATGTSQREGKTIIEIRKRKIGGSRKNPDRSGVSCTLTAINETPEGPPHHPHTVSFSPGKKRSHGEFSGRFKGSLPMSQAGLRLRSGCDPLPEPQAPPHTP